MIKIEDLTNYQRKVLRYIVDDKMRTKEIANIFGVTDRSIQRIIVKLRDKGYLDGLNLPQQKRTFSRHCRICNYKKAIHMHHILPKHLGGSNRKENLIPLCPNHHRLLHEKLIAAIPSENNLWVIYLKGKIITLQK